MSEPVAKVSTHGDSQHITPPSGRSYWVPVNERVEVCDICQGEGHHDSCFDCGNRGYHWLVTNPACTDGGPYWCCIDGDGTGLWCDSCLAYAATDQEVTDE